MAGLDAFGVQLKRGDGASTEVFTAIGNITSLTYPEMERETYDVTAHDSPNQWREFIGGLVDGGEFTIELNYDPSVHDTLIDDFADSAARNYQLVDPTGTQTWDVAAFMTGFSAEAPVDDKYSAEVTFKVTGKPTIGSGS